MTSKAQRRRNKKRRDKPSPEALSPDNRPEPLHPLQPVPHLCSHAGRCCWEAPIPLTPFDVWRMVCAPGGVLRKGGVKTTRDLYVGEHPIAVLRVNKANGIPECFLVPTPYAGAPEAVRHCPFLLWDKSPISRKEAKVLTGGDLPGPGAFWSSNGGPKFRCALGPAAPIQCLTFPMGRGATVTEEGELRWFLFCKTDTCQKCMPSTVRPDGLGETIHQWASRKEVVMMHTYADDYVRIQTAMYQRQMHPDTAMLMARTMFDFDGFMLDQGVPEDEIYDRRPTTPGETLMAVEQMLQAMVPVTEDGSIIQTGHGNEPH